MDINLLRAQLLIEAADILNEAGARQKQSGMYRDRITKINQQIDKLKRNNGSKDEIERLERQKHAYEIWLEKYGTDTRKEQKINNKGVNELQKQGYNKDMAITALGEKNFPKKAKYQNGVQGKSYNGVDTNKPMGIKQYEKLAGPSDITLAIIKEAKKNIKFKYFR